METAFVLTCKDKYTITCNETPTTELQTERLTILEPVYSSSKIGKNSVGLSGFIFQKSS